MYDGNVTFKYFQQTNELEKAFEEAKASYEKEVNDVKAERDKTIAGNCSEI